jgi:two-component system cell cycle sensor histidine kinase/response regulator CckA
VIRTENRYLDTLARGYDEIEEGDYIVLHVSDNGNGISPVDLEKIFEPFYTKKVMGRNGTGLGLTIVWGAVKDHHGYIDVRSVEGEGSTFSLYFPATREWLDNRQQPLSPATYMGRGEFLLVADDVEAQRTLATAMLRKLGYEVASVSSGEEAVAFVKTKKADLVVLDMIMDPGMDGLGTYQRIIEINPGQKAVIVSGFSETELVNKAQALGAGTYVRKPYVMEKLGQAIRSELDKR